MTTRTFTGKGGETWEWDETPEVLEALKKLHSSTRAVTDTKLRKPHKYNPEQ
tara:strand:+ start:259 stop:414 length:156 start_codon:yes stop_codon:yes gene_type:complete